MLKNIFKIFVWLVAIFCYILPIGIILWLGLTSGTVTVMFILHMIGCCLAIMNRGAY